MAAYIPYAIITHGLYSGLVSTMGSITIGTCRLVKSLYSTENPDVGLAIKELDIERKLKVINSVISKIKHTSHNGETKIKLNNLEKSQIFEALDNKNASLDDDPIELSLNYLKQTIQDIHHNLHDINEKVNRYNKKWFRSWRKLNVQDLLNSLRLNAKLLDLRYDDLTKIFLFLKSKNR